MYYVQLGRSWDDPWPRYWDNFHKHCTRLAHDDDDDTATTGAIMLRELAPDGVLKMDGPHWELTWPSQAHHTMFVMKWS